MAATVESHEIGFTPTYTELYHPDISSIRVYESPELAAQAAADHIANIAINKPSAVITYATGETMKPVYAAVAQAIDSHLVDFRDTTLFHLDERFPCAPTDPCSAAKFLRESVIIPFGIPQDQVFLINGQAEDPVEEAKRYNDLLLTHPVDLAILGIGPAPGGHIGFNESGTPFTLETHYVPMLAPQTHDRDRVQRREQTPDGAITQGPANIRRANQIILVAYGEKGKALRAALRVQINEKYPASALRLVGNKVTMFIDTAAVEIIRSPFTA